MAPWRDCYSFNALGPPRHIFAGDIFGIDLLDENWYILIHISVKFASNDSLEHKSSLNQVMVGCLFRHQTIRWTNTDFKLVGGFSNKLQGSVNQIINFLWHDDVIKWKSFPRYWPFVRGIHRFPVNSPHKDQWRGTLMLSLICARINCWVNNREAADLRRHRAHYDVIVMEENVLENVDHFVQARLWSIVLSFINVFIVLYD